MKWIGASTELVMDHPVEWVWEFVSNIENFRTMGRRCRGAEMDVGGRAWSRVDI